MIKEVFKDMGRYLPSSIVPAVVGLIAVPIITRLFSPNDYGNYVLVLATVSVLLLVTAGWLSSSTIRFFPAYQLNSDLGEFYATIVKLALISVAIITFLSLGILFLIKGSISSSFYSLMRIGILVFIVTSLFNVLLHFLRAKRHIGWYTFFSIWHKVMALAFGVVLVVFLRCGVEGLLWGSVISIALVITLLWKVAIEGPELRTADFSTPLFMQAAKYGFPIVVASLAQWILSLSDRYILEFFWGSREVGVYSLGYAVSQQSIFLVVSLFWLAATPIEMAIWETQGERASQEFLSKLTRYYLLIGLPAVVGLSVLAKSLIGVLAPREYYQGYKIVPLVALGVFLLGLRRRFASGLTYHKKTHLSMFCVVSSALLNVGLNFLLVPRYGYIAAAITTAASYAFLLLLEVVISRRFFVWNFPFKSLEKGICASGVMGGVVYYIDSSLTSYALINLILGIPLGVLIYVVVLFSLREIRVEDIQELKTLRVENFR